MLFKIKELENGILCKLILIKPWETAKKSQGLIHYYLIAWTTLTTFENGDMAYHYFLIPTTTNRNIKNDSFLKIESKDWFENKEVFLKLDEIFVMQDFDFRTWIQHSTGEVCDVMPRLIVDSTVGLWKLKDKNIWEKISFFLTDSFRKNRTMFFILDRMSFQDNNKYWRKKLKSKYVYNTNAFIPEWSENFDEFSSNVLDYINEIRINNNNKTKKEYLINYIDKHFDKQKDKKKIVEFKRYFNLNKE